MIKWHRLLGLALTDFFTGSSWVVELEKDLSLKQQFLDIVILRKEEETIDKVLPDGLNNLKKYNLLSYKSLREPFDDWALKELNGHYVNYRKQVSPSLKKLLPEKEFQLYGVSTRLPKSLFSQIKSVKIQEGVYDVEWGVDLIRIIVLSEISHAEHNMIWHLFSGIKHEVRFAAQQYKARTQEMSTIMNQLFENYEVEGLVMSYTMQDFQKDYIMDHLSLISPDEVLKRYSPDEVLKRYSPDEVLKRYSSDEVLKRYSSDDRLKGISPDDRLKGISLEEIQNYLEKHKNEVN